MSAKRVARYNALVVDYLVARADRSQQANHSESRLFDTDGSKYLLQHEQDIPNQIRLSLSLAAFTDNLGVARSLASITADLHAKHQEYCSIRSDADGQYQLVVIIQLDALQRLDPIQQLSRLQAIGCIRADVLCWPLRSALSRHCRQSHSPCKAHSINTQPCYCQNPATAITVLQT